jgi:hypothetical protein
MTTKGTYMDETMAYLEGWAAGYDDEYPENPYAEGSEEAKDWEKGYDDGSYNS